MTGLRIAARVESSSCEAELAHAPLLHDPDRLGSESAERLADVAAHQVALLEARELEDAAAGREHPRVLVADDEARRRAPGSSPRAAGR